LIICLFLVFAIAFAAPIFRDGKIQSDAKTSALNPKLVNYINSLKTSWTARNHEMWKGKTIRQVKRLLGAHLYTATGDENRKTFTPEMIKATPTSFDSRAAWPKCTTIGNILNQAECGSCWAFGAVESITDRFCINTNASVLIELSEMDLVTCDSEQGGCEGGDPYSAWGWIQKNGIVSAACSPYTIPTCPPAQQPCLNFVPTPSCVKTCNNSVNWDSNKKYISDHYYVGPKQEEICTEIYQSGPVEGAFSVYEDFIHYKSGVYQHTTGSYLGGHAIKIIGYGTENDLPYWEVANSWTTYWGNKGFFKILRGADECGIESGVVGGTPKIN